MHLFFSKRFSRIGEGGLNVLCLYTILLADLFSAHPAR